MAGSNYQHPERRLGEGPDRDGDGLSDSFEQRWGSNPDKADPDGDGLNDWAEWWLDTKPNVADTDGDGYEDGEDLAFGDPLRPNAGGAARAKFIADVRKQFAAEGSDRDRDLVRDYLEDQAGTKQDNPDSDGDGISDGVEMMMKTPQHSTPDDTTDLDGAIERLGNLRASTDALGPSGASSGMDDLAADSAVAGAGAVSYGEPAADIDAVSYDDAASYDEAVAYDDTVADADMAGDDGGFAPDGDAFA